MNIIPIILIVSIFFSTAAFIEKFALKHISIESYFVLREFCMVLILSGFFITRSSKIISDLKKLDLVTTLKILIAPFIIFTGLYLVYYVIQNIEKFNTSISILLALSYGIMLVLGLFIDLFYLKTKISGTNILGVIVIAVGICMCLHKKDIKF